MTSHSRFFSPIALVAVLLFGLAGCDAFSPDEEENPGGIVRFVGQVLNDATNNPVPGAFVQIQPYNNLPVETDAEGRYDFELEIDSTQTLTVVVSRDGFDGTSVEVLGVVDRTISVPTARIRQLVDDQPVSGSASNILMLAQSAQSIGVKESGSQEVVQITFQVADSLGRPIVLEQSVDVSFSLGVSPGGGEFIFPQTASTDNNGQVTANLSAGTRAGAVQLVAEARVDGRTIRSIPVSVAIHGGLPNQTHFSVGPQRFNFPGLLRFGVENDISVIVGDQYANPVRPQTAVYFTASHGVVEGSTLTDDLGRGTVTLLSGNPLPSDGIGFVTARSADVNQDDVVGRTPVVFSGVTVVTVSPAIARLGQTYDVTVTDPNGNPLVAGTTLSVRVEGTRVKAVGNTSVTFDDTAFIDQNGDGDNLDYADVVRGPGITEFRFRAVEDRSFNEEDGEPLVESVTIIVRGENGDLEIVLTSDGGAPSLRTAEAEFELVTPDKLIARGLERP
ncbi:MAG: hypothetical protein AAGJ10_19110 [Bacteroidota bacterium]